MKLPILLIVVSIALAVADIWIASFLMHKDNAEWQSCPVSVTVVMVGLGSFIGLVLGIAWIIDHKEKEPRR